MSYIIYKTNDDTYEVVNLVNGKPYAKPTTLDKAVNVLLILNGINRITKKKKK